MNKKRINSSVLLSIFRRKGSEGKFTQIITDNNKSLFLDELLLLEDGEEPLIGYKEDKIKWILITNYRILGKGFFILYADLKKVNIALREEWNDGIMDKNEFTRISLENSEKKVYIITLEKGEPFIGIYQLLDYIANISS